MNVEHKKIINALMEGNEKFASLNRNELKKHVAGQSPKVAILTCSDSRVSPELIFDVGIGDIFVVRVAGNVAFEPSVIGSLEYAVEHLEVRVLLIMGHTHCGAVAAAEEYDSEPAGLLGEIKKSFSMESDHVLANVKRQVKKLPERSKVVELALNEDRLKIIGVIYDLETGRAEFILDI